MLTNPRRIRHGAKPLATAVFAMWGLASLAPLGACESADPETSVLTTTTATGTGGGGTLCAPDDNLADADNPSCDVSAGDYQPGSADDGWDPCISDDGAYHPFEPSISSVARVGAFEQIATRLGFGQGAAPSAQAFLDARVIYATDEGLESRVARREDEHFPAAAAACNELGPAELAAVRDRCVGPAQLQPLLNDAFSGGIDGQEPARMAARIEAGLLWFFYLSTYKEATTCTATPKDCDSSYAYYTGGEPRTGGFGLARYARARSVQAHDRTWDGLLAVRCWRDLDNPAGEAQNVGLRDQALAQLDRAMLRTLALIVRQRAEQLPCDAAWETVRILGPVLDREAVTRDPAAALALRAEVARADPSAVDVDALVGAIDAIFPCP